MNSCRGAGPDGTSTATPSCPRSKWRSETGGRRWQPVQFKRVVSDDGRTQDERTTKTLDHRCLPRRQTRCPATGPDTGESGEAERKPQITDFDSAGFRFRRPVARPLSPVRNGCARSFGSCADSGQAAADSGEAGRRIAPRTKASSSPNSFVRWRRSSNLPANESRN